MVSSGGRVLAVVVLLLGIVGGAVGVALGKGLSKPTPVEPGVAEEIYEPGMTLDEVARAASGKVGEVIPPCPSEPQVEALKRAKIEFGPCDPVPESGAGMIMQPPEAQEPTGAAVCPALAGGLGTPDLSLFLPCGIGAKIIDAPVVTVNGESCLRVTYVAKRGAEPVTEVLCEGDIPTVGGQPVGAKK